MGDSTPGPSGSGEEEEVEEEEDIDMAEEDLDALDDETREMTLTRMKEQRASKRAEEKEKMKPIRKAEAALKKELGRKLTNGEKNSIRLVLVSFRLHLLSVGYKADISSIILNYKMFGVIYRIKSYPYNR